MRTSEEPASVRCFWGGGGGGEPDLDGLDVCRKRDWTYQCKVGTGRQEAWRKRKEEIYPCSGRRLEVSWYWIDR